MSELTRKIRSRRYNVNPKVSLALEVDTKEGARLIFQVVDCSLTSLGVVAAAIANDSKFQLTDYPSTRLGTQAATTTNDSRFQSGDIFASSKLAWNNEELFLGRLVIHSTRQKEGFLLLGLGLLDTKLPLDGVLSKLLDLNHQIDIDPHGFELSPDKFNVGTFSSLPNESVDLFSRCKQYNIYFSEWEKTTRFKYKMIREESQGPRIKLRTPRRNGRNDFLVMCSNDYLGLASDPRVCEVVTKVTKTYGFGSTGSPLSTGTTDIHEELKDLIAKTFRKEKALLFNSGYTANVGGIPSLVTETDLIVADILSHQSIQDGMRMASSTNKFFKHNSMSHLERVLTNSRDQHNGCLLVTEGIFSMDGDCPDLRKFVSLAKTHKARTYLDEAHSFGVIGPKGLGAAFKYNAIDDIDIIMGTFSKICGGIGGFLAGPKEVMDWYFWLAKSHAFTVSIPPSTAAAMLEALRIVISEPQLPERLQKNIRHFINGLKELGCPLSDKHEGAVIPVIVGDPQKFEIMTKVLYDAGVYTLPIEYPAVNKRGARFRFTIMATHTESDLDYALSTIATAMEKAKFTFSEVIQQYANVTTSSEDHQE